MIYLDNAATTRISEPVLNAMMPYLREEYGNPSSAYSLGIKARDAIEEAREKVAHLINAEPEEIYFTSGGSEANNWAIDGYTTLTSKIEHPSILNRFCGKSVCVDGKGFVNTNIIRQEVSDVAWGLVSVMTANNEIGTIQPVREIADICNEHDVYFHTDAVQAFGQIPINVKAMKIDLLSASGHKIHAPKGVGCLYVREGVEIAPLISGGHQESGKRAGTENVASIVGFGEAAYQAEKTMSSRSEYVTQMRDYLIKNLCNEITGSHINGSMEHRLPGNISLTINRVSAETLVFMLDRLYGICISAGSACTTGSQKPSHVLKAIGLSDDEARSTIRLSLDETLTIDDANGVIEALKSCTARLRGIKWNH